MGEKGYIRYSVAYSYRHDPKEEEKNPSRQTESLHFSWNQTKGKSQAAESNVVSDIERTIDEIVKLTNNPTSCIDTINENLSSSTPEDSPASARATALSLNTLRALLLSSRSHKIDVSTETAAALAHTAARFLEHADAEVRKSDVELACEVFSRFGDDKATFWGEFKGVEEGRLGLLTYYIARRERAN